MGCGVELNREGKPKYNAKTGKPKYIKYANHTHAIMRTTAEPLKDFQGSPLEFRVFPVYAESGGRGRPPLVKVGFEFLNRTMFADERVKLWCTNSEKFREHYKQLTAWKITDENIVKYAAVLGEKGINKLFYHFIEKNKSTKPIAERNKYCNWYINHIGKNLI